MVSCSPDYRITHENLDNFYEKFRRLRKILIKYLIIKIIIIIIAYCGIRV